MASDRSLSRHSYPRGRLLSVLVGLPPKCRLVLLGGYELFSIFENVLLDNANQRDCSLGLKPAETLIPSQNPFCKFFFMSHCLNPK